MISLKKWALEQLGLAGKTLRESLIKWKDCSDLEYRLTTEARKRGRKLLGKYHPDRSFGSAEKFQAINEVLQRLDTLTIPIPKESLKTSVSVSLYPERSPYGGEIRTRTVRRSYFEFKNEETCSSGVRYDPRKVVRMRPGKN